MNQNPIPLHLRIIFAVVGIVILVSLFMFFGVFFFVVLGLGLIASMYRLIRGGGSVENLDNPEYHQQPTYEQEEEQSPPVIEIEGKVIK